MAASATEPSCSHAWTYAGRDESFVIVGSKRYGPLNYGDAIEVERFGAWVKINGQIAPAREWFAEGDAE